jgi:O-antigen/teichoic acid export membrane protein
MSADGRVLDAAIGGTVEDGRRAGNEASSNAHSPGQVNGRPRLFVHDVALTLTAEVTVMVSSLAVISILGRWLDAHALSEYMLLRRVLSWLLAGALAGLSTGLPRYVARAAGLKHGSETAYFSASLLFLLPLCVFFSAALFVFREQWAHWLFGQRSEAELVVALAILLCGMVIHRTVYGYFRGLLAMSRANAMEVLNLAIVPLAIVVFLHRTGSIALMVGVIGGGTILLSAMFAAPIARHAFESTWQNLTACRRELLRYSLPRVPGDVGVPALQAIGPVIAAHYLRLAAVTPLLLGLNILLVMGYAVGPLGTVLLSKLSRMLGEGRDEEVKARLRFLVTAILEISVFACLQLVVFADVAVRAWVGPRYLADIDVIRLVLLAIPSYLFYVALRSAIDAVTVKPCNAINVLASLALFLGLTAISIRLLPRHSLLVGIAASLFVAHILLGWLTARTFHRFFALSTPWKRVAPSLFLALALGGLAVGARSAFHASLSPALAAALEVAFIMVYVGILARRGSGWIAYTWNVGLRGRRDWQFGSARP